MLLTYSKLRPYYPDVERLRALPSSLDKELAQLDRPPALPWQCKPWLDAARHGFLLRYPYEAPLRVSGADDGRPDFLYEEHGTSARAGGPAISAFAPSHFSMRAGYRFRTPAPYSLLTARLPTASDGPHVVPGVVETWWYPRPLFVVFENPKPGEQYVLSAGDPICALVPVILEPLAAREMTADEVQVVVAEDERYKRESAVISGMSWTSLEGAGFSHRYKVFAKRAQPGQSE
jgi:uncharacterized protein DUF6065